MTQPTVCVGYIHSNEEPILQTSLKIMREYDWVSRIVVLDTDRTDHEKVVDHKTHRFAADFGTGIAKPVEQGGLNQIAARRRLLQLCRETGCDWILVVDADEYFTYATYRAIRHAHDASPRVCRMRVACHHFLDPWSWCNLRPDLSLRLITRCIRADAGACDYKHNPKLARANQTQHCYLSGGEAFVEHTAILHVHTRYLYPHRVRNEKHLEWMRNHADHDPQFQLHPYVLQAIKQS